MALSDHPAPVPVNNDPIERANGIWHKQACPPKPQLRVEISLHDSPRSVESLAAGALPMKRSRWRIILGLIIISGLIFWLELAPLLGRRAVSLI